MIKTKWIPTQVGRRVDKTNENIYGWELVDMSRISPRDKIKPVCFVFGGSATIEDEYANYYARFVERMVGKDAVDIYSFKYGHKDGETTGYISLEELQCIADEIFLPALYDEYYEKYSKEEIAQNLGKINFVSNCFGNVIVTRLLDILGEVLEKGFNYSEEEIFDLANNVTHITYAPEEVTTTSRELGNRIAFKSLRDWAFGEKTKSYYKLYDDKGEERYLGTGKVFRDAKNRITIVSNSTADYRVNVDEHVLSVLELQKDLTSLSNDMRSLTLAHCMAMVLSYSLVEKLDMDNIQDVVTRYLNHENKTEYEKNQEKIFNEEKSTTKKPEQKIANINNDLVNNSENSHSKEIQDSLEIS